VKIEEVMLDKYLKKADENKKQEMMEFKAQTVKWVSTI